MNRVKTACLLVILSSSRALCMQHDEDRPLTPEERVQVEQQILANPGPLTMQIVCDKLRAQEILLLSLDGLDELEEAPILKERMSKLRASADEVAHWRNYLKANELVLAGKEDAFKQQAQQCEAKFIAEYPQARTKMFDLYTGAKQWIEIGRLLNALKVAQAQAQEAKQNEQS